MKQQQQSDILSPLGRRFRNIKQMSSGAVVLFLTDEFYQALYEDAYLLAAVSDTPVQTLRLCGNENVPFCGFRRESLEKIATQLVEIGRRVAICNGLLARPRPYEDIEHDARSPAKDHAHSLDHHSSGPLGLFEQ